MKAQLQLFAAPVLRAGQFTARPYQVRADLAIDREFLTKRATLVVHPTGAGKTILFCMQALKFGGALVLVHRDTLLRQAQAKLSAATGRIVSIERGAERADESPYVVASVQSLHKSRLVDFKRRFPSFPFIIIDEAHRAVAKSYRNVVDAYPDAKVLGVTATPDRSDKVGLKAIFGDSVADEYSIIDATADGWLTPLRFQPVAASVDLSGVKVVGSGADRDFDQSELDSAIVQEAGRIAETVHRAMQASANPDGRLIVFTPGVKTAHAGAGAMNEIRPGSAAVVDGEMEQAFQRKLIERFRAGEFQYIFNCNVMTEGYDDAGLFGILDASPTKSRLRACQRWGRVTRLVSDSIGLLPTPEERRAAIAVSSKPWGTVFDLAFNSAEHDVVSPVDILGGKDIPPEVAKRAREIMRTEGGATTAAIERATEELAAKKRRAIAAKRLAAATAVTLGTPRSVFDRAGLSFIRRTKMSARPDERAKPNMLGLLRHRGIPIPPRCTLSMFRRLLSLDTKREAKGLCRLGGVDWLRKYGVDAWKMPRETAMRIRDGIRDAGRRLTADEIAPLMERTPGED